MSEDWFSTDDIEYLAAKLAERLYWQRTVYTTAQLRRLGPGIQLSRMYAWGYRRIEDVCPSL